MGNRISYNFDKAGNRVSTADPLGNLWTGVYDQQARPIASIDPTGADILLLQCGEPAHGRDKPASEHRIAYLRHLARLVATVGPLGNRTSLGYDQAGRLVPHDQRFRICFYGNIRLGESDSRRDGSAR